MAIHEKPLERSSADPEAFAPPADSRGARDACRPVDELYALAYDELRRRAAAVRRGDPFATISTRTLVHETWLKFSGSATLRFDDQKHLVDIVVRAMRQVLVDSARYRRAARRTGVVVPIDESIPLTSNAADDTLAIDEALSGLEQLDPELAGIVQMRYFAGFTMVEIAEHLGLSESTVRRKTQLALARLKVSLESDRSN
jgi:RNA polymerase sigma factor (TIGR02999 family)